MRDDDVGLAGAAPGVRTQVVQEASAQSAKLAVAAGRDLDLDHRAVTLRGRGAVLAAGRDPLSRSLQAPSDNRGQHLFWKHAALGAESTTDVLGDDAHGLLLEAERAGDRLPHVEYVLGRGPDLEPACFGVWSGGHGARLHRRACHAGRGQVDLRRDAVRAKGGLDFAVRRRLAT